jgi:hypothetical protein
MSDRRGFGFGRGIFGGGIFGIIVILILLSLFLNDDC